MEYAGLIKQIIGNEDINTSLISLLGNIDAYNKSVPTLEELNTALSTLASQGYLNQTSEQAYTIYAYPKNKEVFKPISEATYNSVCLSRFDKLKNSLVERGITKKDINNTLKWH